MNSCKVLYVVFVLFIWCYGQSESACPTGAPCTQYSFQSVGLSGKLVHYASEDTSEIIKNVLGYDAPFAGKANADFNICCQICERDPTCVTFL